MGVEPVVPTSKGSRLEVLGAGRARRYDGPDEHGGICLQLQPAGSQNASLHRSR